MGEPWHDGPAIVVLPDGRRVRGRGLRRDLPDGQHPEFGLYLLGKDPGPFSWEHRWVRWPDFRLPSDPDDAIAALREVHRRAADERVEVACAGGIGRTGTGLAVLAVLTGVPPEEAVAWVRQAYDHQAVETPWQRRWVRRLDL
jgi:protein-tyrosine phosphatase